jgi:hypothetical protein
MRAIVFSTGRGSVVPPLREALRKASWDLVEAANEQQLLALAREAVPGLIGDLNRKVRELLPNALVVRAELPEVEELPESELEAGLPPVGHYAAYHLRVHGQAAPLAVLDTFQDLYDQASGEEA